MVSGQGIVAPEKWLHYLFQLYWFRNKHKKFLVFARWLCTANVFTFVSGMPNMYSKGWDGFGGPPYYATCELF